jgi:hypothetical protein
MGLLQLAMPTARSPGPRPCGLPLDSFKAANAASRSGRTTPLTVVFFSSVL